MAEQTRAETGADETEAPEQEEAQATTAKKHHGSELVDDILDEIDAVLEGQ